MLGSKTNSGSRAAVDSKKSTNEEDKLAAKRLFSLRKTLVLSGQTYDEPLNCDHQNVSGRVWMG